MKADVDELLSIFDQVMLPTAEEEGVYWLKSRRMDGAIIKIIFSMNESYVDFVIKNDHQICTSGLNLNDCCEIKILDKKNKILEIVRRNNQEKCILSLCADPILQYQE